MEQLRKAVLGREATVVSALLAGALLLNGSRSLGEPRLYDPDPQACQVEMIRTTFQANLLPWADQPAAVQQRLRQLQAAMTADTLRECQAKGLLSASQAQALAAELALPSPQGSERAAPVSGQSPARP